MTIGQLIKTARKNAGMTQTDLAKKLGIPYQSIGQWENGLRYPKPKTLQRIADALGIHVMELIGATNYEVEFEVASEDDRPIPDELFNRLNSGIKNIYDSLTDEGKEQLLVGAFVPFSESSDADELPQPKALSKSEIAEQIKYVYGETISDTFSMYVLLDAGDQGEIRGEIKQMLKHRKYLKQEGKLA